MKIGILGIPLPFFKPCLNTRERKILHSTWNFGILFIFVPTIQIYVQKNKKLQKNPQELLMQRQFLHHPWLQGSLEYAAFILHF
jgi:hypothetical protein